MARAGSVNVKFGADVSQLQADAARAKQIVRDTAADMNKAAKVGFSATTNTAITGTPDLGAAAALRQRDKNIASATEDLARKIARNAERERIHDAAVARYQQSTGQIVKDKAQKAFEREIGKPTPDQADTSLALYSTAAAAVTALAYFANEAKKAAQAVAVANRQFEYEAGRMSYSAARGNAFGVPGSNAQGWASLEVSDAARHLAVVRAHHNAPFGFIRDFGFENGHFVYHAGKEEQDAENNLKEAEQRAQILGESLQQQSHIRIRNAAARDGIARSPLEILAQQQKEELIPLLRNMSVPKAPQEARDAYNQTVSTQHDEMELAKRIRKSELGGLRATAEGERIRGEGLQASFEGRNKDVLISQFLQKELADRADERIQLAKAPADAQQLIRDVFEARSTARRGEFQESLRQLIENPGEALSLTTSEAAGPFLSRDKDVQKETNETLDKLYRLLQGLVDKAGLK